MNNDSAPLARSSSSLEPSSNSRLESTAFYIFLITVILAPLSFWSSQYVPLDLVKTLVISIGTIVSVILFAFVAIKERRTILPPKSLSRLSVLVFASLIVSAFLSISPSKSFFGQGFEIGSVSFIILLFIAGFVAFTLVSRKKEQAVILYFGIVAAYIIIYIIQVLRVIFGTGFMSLGILSNITSSLVGGWYNLSSFSMVVAVISLLALSILKLSSKMKIVYAALLLVSAFGALVVSDLRVWSVSVVVFLGLAIGLSIEKWNAMRKSSVDSKTKSFFKCLAWLPIAAFAISAVISWGGSSLSNPLVSRLNVGYSELVLPWQMTLDVTASTIQDFPLFGVGANHFTQAFLAFKPTAINTTDVWGTEFGNGFGLLPTFVTTQGLVGLVLWILLFVFFGLVSARAFKNLPEESDKKFMLVSSFSVSVMLWLISVVSVPSHTILFYAFVATGIFLGYAVSSGSLHSRIYAPADGTRMYKFLPSIAALVVLVFVVWGLVYVKKTIAFMYFASGVKQLTLSGDTKDADMDFTKALKIDPSDVYWRAKTETALQTAQNLASTVTSTSTASTTEVVLSQVTSVLNQGAAYAKNAVDSDPTNYYNYLSQAHLAEAAANIKMPNGYDNAVTAYTTAINANPLNPSIYLSLANLQARQAKYDDAINTLGKALQVKSNYLDAVFLLSQVYAAKGDTSNAIVAAKFAVQLNPQNSSLLFQLGLLDYNNKDYAGAADALGQAIKIQPDYSNAKYFLGLSEARLNDNEKAIVQFEDLAKSNPDNQEIALILASLKNKKPIFSDTVPASTAIGKGSSLPVKEKK